jgi:hypothetical protein
MKSHKSLPETFFILTPEVREKLLTANLTAAEWRIWCYLVSLDPFGDRGAKYLPAELMLKCKVKKSTYFAAKAKFQKLGFFDFKDGVTKVFNLQGHQTQSKSTNYSQQDRVIESKISECQSEISESNSKISECQSEISESNSKISENQTPEPLPEAVSSSSQTIQTYSDFKKTLSEDERERFFYFVRQEVKNFREPIKDLEAWLASKNAADLNRWEVYYKRFQSSRPSKAQNEESGLENSDGSKTPKRLSLREEIEQQRQRALAYYASLKESEQQQETLALNEFLEETEPQTEENTDV